MITLQGQRERVEVLEFSPDSRGLAAPCSNVVQLWDEVTSKASRSTVSRPWVSRLRFLPSGRKLIMGGSAGRLTGLHLFDRDTNETYGVPPERPGAWSASFDLSHDGQGLLLSQSNMLCFRRLSDLSRSEWSVPVVPGSGWPLFLARSRCVIFSRWVEASTVPGGNLSREGTLLVTRDTRTGAVLSEVRSDSRLGSEPVISVDRSLVASHSLNAFTVFHADDFARPLAVVINDSRKEFTGLAFHPSGRFLAATSNDKTVKLYETSTWQLAHAFDWQIGRLRSVAFSPDGTLAAAGGDKGKIVVWDFDL